MPSPKALTFGGAPQPAPEDTRATIFSVPLETRVSLAGGTSLGPAAIIQASNQMTLYEPSFDLRPALMGVATAPMVPVSGGTEKVLARIKQRVGAELAAGRLPILIGGEHTVSVGALEARLEQHGPGFTLMCLDAHLDLADCCPGKRYCHGSLIRHALAQGVKVVLMGARACSLEEAVLAKEFGLKPVWASQVLADPSWLERSLEGVTGPVYLSLDLDGLDPSVMPATGSPEPGGLSYSQAAAWVRLIAERFPVLGLDLVGFAPMNDCPAWDMTAARLLHLAMGHVLVNQHRHREKRA